ncbi:MAG TPA: 30S ribosomal protein S7 [Candidatus Acetothermia bacterium]|jgi:small subunit ribosomal protein S7|nr:30S ribosomal protein S7 [Candidatus Bipolaricaulota bacterium]HDO74492.1 30S ribosomal protein S7 [Candidatus Acetothermia bacterium]HEX32434.1 30S ribosomal protein S7 [Candidatus Acetothermia bacterium]
MQLPGRDVKPDIKYNSQLLAKLINYVMQDGKKSVAEKVVYDALEQISSRSDEAPLEVFNAALANCSPRLEVRTRRVGGANYQVPYEVPQDRQIALALRWIVSAARDRSGNTMGGRLAAEIMDAARKEGKAYNKRLDVHRMAEANRAFAHYRW